MKKEWDFVKNRQNSSIWPKLATFRTRYHVLGFLWSFQQIFPKIMGFSEQKNHQNSSIWPELATFHANYHVLGFTSSFQQKICKKCGVLWKTIKTHRCGRNENDFGASEEIYVEVGKLRKKKKNKARMRPRRGAFWFGWVRQEAKGIGMKCSLQRELCTFN